MDPNTGKLYPSREAAQAAMDGGHPGKYKSPIELLGDALVAEELSKIVKKYRAVEKKEKWLKKKAKKKAAKKSRKRNR